MASAEVSQAGEECVLYALTSRDTTSLVHLGILRENH